MKRIGAIFILLALGVAAFGLTRSLRCKDAGPGLDRFQDVSFLTRKLGLNESQAREIKALHGVLGAELSGCCERHCAARAQLAKALVCETNGTGAADAVLLEMCRAYEQGERATLANIRKVRSVLNADQKRKFDEMITRCMCRECPMTSGKQCCD